MRDENLADDPFSSLIPGPSSLMSGGSSGDLSDDVMTYGLSGGADRVRHGEWGRSSVTDDTDAVDPEQGRAAVGGIVGPAANPLQGRHQQAARQLQPERSGQLLLDHVPHHVGDAFPQLQHHVAHKAIADDDVGLALEQLAALDVAHKAKASGGEQGKGRARELAALGVLLPITQQSHLWMSDA